MNFESDVMRHDGDDGAKRYVLKTESNFSKKSLKDYLVFIFYCTLLTVPLYAITISVLKHDWIMVIIDALIVPIGFVHGILMLTGFLG